MGWQGDDNICFHTYLSINNSMFWSFLLDRGCAIIKASFMCTLAEDGLECDTTFNINSTRYSNSAIHH